MSSRALTGAASGSTCCRVAWTYLIALGSNRRGRHGGPRDEVAAACRALGPALGSVRAVSAIAESEAIGPSIRRFANAVAAVSSELDPPAVLLAVKAIERAFGRRRGRRWGARVIDLDLIGWSGGVWRSRDLTIPHPRFRERPFVLAPLSTLAPIWRDPVTHRTARQLHARLTAARPVNRR